MVLTSPVSAVVPSSGVTTVAAVDARLARGLAIATGVLYCLGFAGADLWPFAFVALVPLTVALHGRSVRACWGLGALAGFTMNALGMYWLPATLESFGEWPGWLSWSVSLLACGYQAGRVAVFGALYAAARDRGWPDAPVFLLAFAASEVMYPALVPWYFAASVHQVPALTQLAEVGGPYLVGLVLLLPNLAVAELCLSRLLHRPWRARRVVLGGAAPLVAALVGALRIAQVDARTREAEPVRAGLIQANMPLRQSHRDHVEALRRHLRMSRELELEGVDFTVWSESALKNLPPSGVKYLERQLRGRLRVPALVGAFLPNADGGVANAALATDRRGQVIGRYDKQRLLAFAETVPFADTLPLPEGWRGPGHLRPGTSSEPVLLAGHRVTVLICYEDLLPSFVNHAVRQGRPELLVNLTNDGWFGATTAPWIHLALAKFRAIEHRRYLIRSTNSGVSAVVDPVGRLVAHAPAFRQETLATEVRWMSGSTVYETLGDAPWWAASALVIGLALRPRARGSAGRSRPR